DALPICRARYPGLLDRVHRDRGRAPRTQLRRRDHLRSAALRVARPGHLDAERRDPGRDQTRACGQPDPDHPGPRVALRRRRPVLPLSLAATQEGQAGRRCSRPKAGEASAVTAASASANEVVRWAVAPRRIAWAGIAVAGLGFWLTLPPVLVRGIAWPIAFGFVGIVAGASAVAQGA